MMLFSCAHDELEPQLQQFDPRYPARIRCCLDWSREGKGTVKDRHGSLDRTGVDWEILPGTCYLPLGCSSWI